MMLQISMIYSGTNIKCKCVREYSSDDQLNFLVMNSAQNKIEYLLLLIQVTTYILKRISKKKKCQ